MVTDDSALLDAVPDYVSVGSLLKAHPQADGGRRYVYFEASNEGQDQQDEVVLAKALSESRDFYLRYGNVDIDHFTQIGAKLGIPDYPLYEIGRPVEVGQRDGSTFVKSEIFSGSGAAAEKANMVWSGLTEVKPPHRWYPSVGGSVLQKAIQVDERTQARRGVISKVRWSNVGLSKTPVNQHVQVCGTMPVGTFAKALTAGYGTDSATLSGGAALREQSLDRGVSSYWDFRERLSKALRDGTAGQNPGSSELVAFAAKQFGLSRGDAAEYVERFMRDLQTGISKKRNAA